MIITYIRGLEASRIRYTKILNSKFRIWITSPIHVHLEFSSKCRKFGKCFTHQGENAEKVHHHDELRLAP